MNPKVAVFFLAFLPQFVVDGTGPVSAQLFLHGSLVIVVAAFIEPPLILTGSRFTEYYRNNAQFGAWLQKCLGAIFVSLGLRLAFVEK